MTTLSSTDLDIDGKLSGAAAVVAQFKARGVTHIYGVPGGDCSLDIIDAAEAVGIAFVLTRSENSAAMMAAAAYQVTGKLGVVLTTRGPGLANGVNGVACAMLDRCGIVIISDGYENDQAFVSHQRFDQQRVLEPIVKGSLRVESPTALPALGPLFDLAMASPAGPVYLEVTGQGMRNSVPALSFPIQPAHSAPLPAAQATGIAAARKLMAAARRPVIIAGLQTRGAQAAEGLRALAAQWQCPVFTTYMGKGSIPDADALMMGHFMAGGAEAETMKSADLILMYGTDPIELLPKPWRYEGAVIDLGTYPFPRNHYVPAVALIGDLAATAKQLAQDLPRSPWKPEAIKALKAHMRERAIALEDGVITPTLLAQTACGLLPSNARITVDAGAHMLPVVAFFEAKNPYDALISRGLATMAYALPSAIGAALADPARPVVAFTGDGGLMMCASELATAAQAGCRLTVVVFNDSAIAMIGVKQNQRGFERKGMDYSQSDFAQVAKGFGCAGVRVHEPAELAAALEKALAGAGTTVVDVIVDPSTYHSQIKSLRG
ncbi:Acetolactate synthase (plasmid) [Variovorax sp. SRS16]|uniref:thiamine pyrophosphate-binding protein n=1 Tax=Variovorax sp. SRS16 TaxID=282217 RepID=UPI0013191E98|nr:thiamine pyrophosphate-binding protein [Variovorax sp. SRS16]VTU45605.1 Acetolactate synthase [Variovorax sp. SRS16]